jgi:hypothetical protein
MLAGLSTAHQIGLGLSGLAFVVFALVSSMLVPRRYPDFPGRHKGTFILVCFLFFIGMMTAVFVFGKEEEKPKHHEAISLVSRS